MKRLISLFRRRPAAQVVPGPATSTVERVDRIARLLRQGTPASRLATPEALGALLGELIDAHRSQGRRLDAVLIRAVELWGDELDEARPADAPAPRPAPGRRPR
ncbi:MAG: hypothetical protein ACRCZP_11000 [Phycicoccus sp.]